MICFLKIDERFLYDQLTVYIEKILSDIMPAYRKGYNSAADLGFNFRGCIKWNLGFGKHFEPPKGVLGSAPEANTFRAICSLKLA